MFHGKCREEIQRLTGELAAARDRVAACEKERDAAAAVADSTAAKHSASLREVQAVRKERDDLLALLGTVAGRLTPRDGHIAECLSRNAELVAAAALPSLTASVSVTTIGGFPVARLLEKLATVPSVLEAELGSVLVAPRVATKVAGEDTVELTVTSKFRGTFESCCEDLHSVFSGPLGLKLSGGAFQTEPETRKAEFAYVK